MHTISGHRPCLAVGEILGNGNNAINHLSRFGLCLSPATGAIRFGKKVAFPWKFDGKVNQTAKQLGKPPRPAPTTRQGPKLGRNDPCYCGSCKKYKQCHLAADGA